MLPDETTILNFRRLLETHGLTDKLFALVRELLESKGLLLKFGTLVDATLIAAPPSIKNADGKRDPQMTQTKKGNTWHFGMKVHVGADSRSGLIHTGRTTTAKVADCVEAEHLLHGEERRVFTDRGYDYPCVHQAIARLGALDGVAIRRTAGASKPRPRRCSIASWPRSAAMSNIPFGSSSASSATRRCATAGWRRTPIRSRGCSRRSIRIWESGG